MKKIITLNNNKYVKYYICCNITYRIIIIIDNMFVFTLILDQYVVK